jgi:hypothetical protein
MNSATEALSVYDPFRAKCSASLTKAFMILFRMIPAISNPKKSAGMEELFTG